MKHIICIMVLVAGFGICILASTMMPASAQDSLSIQSVTPLPDRASLVARYEIVFITSQNGALQGGVDSIYITFPEETQIPSSIEKIHVHVNGDDLSQNGEVIVDSNRISITPVNGVAAGSRCIVLFSQAAGITNPTLSQEVGDGAPDDLYVLTVATSRDTADTFEYEIYDWVGASPMELAQYDPCTVWGAGFMPGSTIHLNGSEGGPVKGSGEVDQKGFFRFTGLSTGWNEVNLVASEGTGRRAEVEGNEPELVPGQPPVAAFDYAPTNPDAFPVENPVANEEITFDASASSDSDSLIVTWHWDFGDGGISMEKMATHIYTMPGQYTVDLILTDTTGATGITSKTVSVVEYVPEEGNNPPIANAGSDQVIQSEVAEGIEVILDASASTDADDDPLTYLWRWESGSAAGINPSIMLAQGTTSITLTVSDGELSGTDTVLIIIDQEPEEEVTPTPGETVPAYSHVKFTYNPRTPVRGEIIRFDGSESVIADGPAASYKWDFGDDETGSGIEATHVYDDPGIYTISFFIRDRYGNVFSYSTIVNVKESLEVDETPSETTTASEQTEDDSGSSLLIWVMVVIIIVIIAGIGIFLLRGRLKARSSDS